MRPKRDSAGWLSESVGARPDASVQILSLYLAGTSVCAHTWAWWDSSWPKAQILEEMRRDVAAQSYGKWFHVGSCSLTRCLLRSFSNTGGLERTQLE
ncbi:hypothetical protein EV356DRAFT_19319 [Viridothelium virens]|uniref:Uncharacterized protein n=1 Tax=Viridothelium virens TaxID=1048519 RepID=A0A6A6GV77_VIRVR|nr:hypothetical protein EV356DRAFT_19319 [Viridothelium virens]